MIKSVNDAKHNIVSFNKCVRIVAAPEEVHKYLVFFAKTAAWKSSGQTTHQQL